MPDGRRSALRFVFAFLLGVGGAWASPNSRPPTARAGSDQTAVQGAAITLNGSASSDPDGHALVFMWTLASKPEGSEAVLRNPVSVFPTFVADRPGSYTINLIVSDGTTRRPQFSSDLNIQFSASGRCRPESNGPASGLVMLNGSRSTDADGNALTFAWEFVTRPDGSTATISNPIAVMPTFTADVPASLSSS